mgnify:CR=1 FL=1
MHTPSCPDIPYQAIVEQSLAGIYVLQNECYQYVNATFAGMLGYTPEEMIGLGLEQSVPPDFVDDVFDLYRRRISGELSNLRFITRGRHRDGHVVLIDVHGIRIDYRGRPAVVGVGIDVTNQVRRDEELERSRAELRKLAAHMNTMREEHRAHFARELHDVLGGMLTSIKMDVTRIMRRATTPELVDIAQELLELSQQTIDEARRISEELRPSVLDNLGLEVAIDRELRIFARRHDVECHFEAADFCTELSQMEQTTLFRIVQEALTNIARHAQAKQIEVRLYRHEGSLHLEINDDGVGIDLSSDRGTLGILGMTERARELGGTLNIGRRPEGGTALHLRVPA